MLVDDLITGDVPCLKQMVDAHAETGGNIVAVEEVAREHTNRYGVLDPLEDDGRLVAMRGMVEKPEPAKAPSRLAVIGRYILLPEVFAHLDRHQTGAGGEIQLTDAMARMIGRQPFHGLRFAGQRFDCGTRLGYLEAVVACAMAREDLRPGMHTILERYR
jgi:UTP--glucose-1-phosphate uridylyltransferase